MSEDEVEIEPEDDEEYQVVPLSPIRKLEKRIDELEEKKDVGNAKGVFNEVLDLVKANQRMVEEMVKSNTELRRELEKLPDKIDEVTEQWGEFLDMLKQGEEKQQTPATGVSEEMSDEMGKLVELNKNLIDKNEEMVESIRSLKRSMRGTVGSRKSPKVRVKKNSGKEKTGRRESSKRNPSKANKGQNMSKGGGSDNRRNPRVKIKDEDKNESAERE